ncbi:MAG: ABC transporter ATP-binding protein [Planctomycetota bacterium]
MASLEARGVRTVAGGPFDVSIEAGRCTSLWDPSGSGKSLLLRATADLDPHEGDVFVDGAAQGTMEGPTWRRRVGYLPTKSGWWPPPSRSTSKGRAGSSTNGSGCGSTG